MNQRTRAITAAASLLFGSALAAAPTASATPPAATAATAPTSIAAAPTAAETRIAVVRSWYNRYLLRDSGADPGSRYWVEQLRDRPAAEVLTQFLATPEGVENQVAVIYINNLSRTPSGDDGARYWVDGVAAGRFPLEWVEQNVLASAEYVDLPGGNYDRVPLVEAWYSTLLQRDPYGPGETAYWEGRLRRAPTLQVLRELWYTPEAVDARVSQHYVVYLGREAQPGELAYWYPGEVVSDDATAVAIAASPEGQARGVQEYG